MELWGAGAVFSLTKYSDTNGSEVMLIKDWRDLFNQVSIVAFIFIKNFRHKKYYILFCGKLLTILIAPYLSSVKGKLLRVFAV